LGLLYAVSLAFGGRAGAQSPPGLPQQVWSEGGGGYACGPLLNSFIKPSDGNSFAGPIGTTWKNIGGVEVNLPVTAASEDCFLVTLSGNAGAFGPDEFDQCYIRAIAGQATMFPRSERTLAIEAEDSVPPSTGPLLWSIAFQWNYRFTPSTPSVPIRLQWRAEDADTTCWLVSWLLTVQRFD
jgi:hypothetical protein